MAAITALDHFHSYPYGLKFTVRTDHAALCWLLHFKNPAGQLARWIEKVQTYDFDIVHRAGRSHDNVDKLIRRPCGDCRYCERQKGKNLFPGLRTGVVPDPEDA